MELREFKQKELNIGECYYMKYYNTDYYFMYLGLTKSSTDCYYISGNGFGRSDNFSSAFTNCRLATNFEKRWLKECIKQNKFVSKDQIRVDDMINDYEIY